MASRTDDAVLRVLAGLFSFVFWVLLATGVLVMVALPVAKLLTGPGSGWEIGIGVPVELREELTGAVRTPWGEGSMELEGVRGTLRVPVAAVPWAVFLAFLVYVGLAGSAIILFFHHLRCLIRPVRAGTPFDPGNARRLRWMGLLALGYAALKGVGEIGGWWIAAGNLTSEAFYLRYGLPVDGAVVVLGLVLLALAEVFRHGAALEDERALVI